MAPAMDERLVRRLVNNLCHSYQGFLAVHETAQNSGVPADAYLANSLHHELVEEQISVRHAVDSAGEDQRGQLMQVIQATDRILKLCAEFPQAIV